MSDNRFSLKGVHTVGGAVYAAPHELHNEVKITLPDDYFGHGVPWPAYIEVVDFVVLPGCTWCQCEHVCHTTKEPKHHAYGFTAETTPVKTPFGTFHVCAACKADCYAEFASPQPDRSGIAADDDPMLRPQAEPQLPMVKCLGCGETGLPLSQGRVQDRFDPTSAIGGAYLCSGCWEAIDNADEVTGAYGAACISLRRVGDMPK